MHKAVHLLLAAVHLNEEGLAKVQAEQAHDGFGIHPLVVQDRFYVKLLHAGSAHKVLHIRDGTQFDLKLFQFLSLPEKNLYKTGES